MRDLSAWLAVIIITIGMLRYCYLILKRIVNPVPSTWLIAGTGMAISYGAYWNTENPTWFGNITNLLGAVEIWIIFFTVTWALYRDKEFSLKFDPLQVYSLIGSGIVLVIWIIGNPEIAFWLIQLLMVISYAPTVGKLLLWGKNFDHTPMWATICVASAFGTVPAWIDGDELGIFNSIRAIATAGITFAIMFRLDYRAWKMRHQEVHHE